MRLARSSLLAVLALLVVGTASAQAGLGANENISLQFDAKAGQTGLPVTVRLVNTNSPPDAATTNTVCNVGDTSPPCANPEPGIALVPSCGEPSSAHCPVASADPGVFKLPATATGKAGSDCVGKVFDIVSTGDAVGTIRFVLQDGTRLTIAGQATCEIGFTVDVLKVPTKDAQSFQPGMQTNATGEHTQVLGAFAPGNPGLHAIAQSNVSTITRGDTASLATTASGDIALGSGTLSDGATVSGLASPQSAGTVEFRLYGPDDATCAGTPVFTSTKNVTPAGTTASATSDAFTPTQVGTYRWIASYSGDVNNIGKAGACNDANESTVVSAAAPPPPPPPGGGGNPLPPDPKPVLTGFRFSPSTFKAKKGSKIIFSLSEDASVRVVVDRSTVGRRVGGKCRAATKANRKRPKCTRLVRLGGALSLPGKQGANSLKYNGRIGGRRLAVGKYRATATATDSVPQASAPARASFRVKP